MTGDLADAGKVTEQMSTAQGVLAGVVGPVGLPAVAGSRSAPSPTQRYHPALASRQSTHKTPGHRPTARTSAQPCWPHGCPCGCPRRLSLEPGRRVRSWSLPSFSFDRGGGDGRPAGRADRTARGLEPASYEVTARPIGRACDGRSSRADRSIDRHGAGRLQGQTRPATTTSTNMPPSLIGVFSDELSTTDARLIHYYLCTSYGKIIAVAFLVTTRAVR